MKTLKILITIILILAFSTQQPYAEEQEVVIPPIVLLGGLVLGIVVVAAVVVIYISSSHEADQDKPVDIVLERSTDHQTWVPVSTNTVALAGRTPISFYSEMLSETNDVAFYRAGLLKR